MAYIQIENLNFSYPGQKECLKNIHLSIEQGEFVVLMGQSGCGKTTLLKLLKPELSPEGERTGSIKIDGVELENLPLRYSAEKIGIIGQNPENQIITDKVWHELAFGLENLGFPQQVIQRKVAEMANYFGIHKWFHQNTADLSGGQKQLLNLAAVMVMQPSILLLDEPTSQLDPIAATEFMATLRRLHEELGITIILIEHRLEEALTLANRVLVMEQGQLIYDGESRGIIQQLPKNHPMLEALPTPMRIFSEVGIGGTIPLTIREGQIWLDKQIIHEKNFEEVSQIKNELVLEAKNLYFRYDKNSLDILKDFSIRLYKGEIVSVLGGNGTGKSTALQMIAGLLKPFQGTITILGKHIKKYKAQELYQNVLAVMPQDPKELFVEKKVHLELEEMALLLEIPKEKVHKVIGQMHLENLLDHHPYDLSGGEQQRLAFAKLLLCEPQILLLDEPTKGLDSFSKNELAFILQALKESGITVLLVTHDIEFSAKYSDRCALFFDGAIASSGSPREFYAGNHFYTTAAHRMSKRIHKNAILCEDVISLCKS